MYLFAIPKKQALKCKKVTDMRGKDSYPALAIKTLIQTRYKVIRTASYCHCARTSLCEMRSTWWALAISSLQTSVFQFVKSSTFFWF